MTGMKADDRMLIPDDPSPMMAVIIFNKKIDVLVDSKNTCRWIQALSMGQGGDKITLVNIYRQFSMPADIFVHKLERIF